ncbi:hypothetical protein AB4574_26480, partial [Vibrio sp. 10N.222.49.E5]|uniref:hypothetical protein n=1 Tax=Vibrio sp. 10N.222.49.E5 TaxID=3229617 RepID=UPI003552F80A
MFNEVKRFLLIMLSLMMLTSCTIVKSGTPMEANYFWGIVSLETNTPEQSIGVFTVDSLGLVLSQGGFNFGYQSTYNMHITDP